MRGSSAVVESRHDEKTGETTLVLKPNGSLSGRQSLILLALCAALMGTIGAAFAVMGAWMVLPFSGLEWLLLAICLRLSLRDSAEREIITIGEDSVKVEKARGKLDQSVRFQRAWVMIDWNESPVRGRPSRLSLRLHGKEVEIGRFLVEYERRALAKELKALLSTR